MEIAEIYINSLVDQKPTEIDSQNNQVDDPLGGNEGVTIYDHFNIDQDFEGIVQPES